LGALFMVLGGLISAAEKRYRYLLRGVEKKKANYGTHHSDRLVGVGV